MPNSMRKLYLFDIDGTLLSPGPAARGCLNQAFADIVGTNPDLQITDVAGLTDVMIIRNTLRKLKANGNVHDLLETVLNRYLSTFSEAYKTSDDAFVFPDALQFLENLEHQGFPVALLTGNVRRGAEIKLGKFGLFDRFPFGVFGDDGETRSDLPLVARERAWEILGEVFRYEDMVIVGDTPNDAAIATEYGMESIIVCRRPAWRTAIEAAGATVIVKRLDQLAKDFHE